MMIRLQKPNKKLLSIGALLLLLGSAGVWFGVYKTNLSVAESSTDLPNFSTILPEHKTIEDFGGWQKLTPPQGGDSFYVYVDTVAGVTVNVSQQELPGKFKNNLSNEMTSLARAYNATNKLEAGDVKVYIGTSAKGPQSVIFAKDGVLVLMKSWSTISDADWIGYINTLTVKK